MLKKTIQYENFDGETVREDFYFNLTKAELVEWQMQHNGGLEELLRKIVGEKNGAQIIHHFKDIIRRSYGRRSDDGKSFMKKPEFFEEFQTTEAFSTLFMEMVTNAEAGAAFINAIMPKKLVDEAKKTVQENTANVLDQGGDAVPSWVSENRDPTAEELRRMSTTELASFMRNRVRVDPK